MSIYIPDEIMGQINRHGEKAYPEEGAGLLLGIELDGIRTVKNLLFLENAREDSARHNRYLITAEDMLRGEKEADRLRLSILGIFHSHPDHPDQPSEFDREYAIPWYSYLITSVQAGRAAGSKCWRLIDDRSGFEPEDILRSLQENRLSK
jgi:proteasome lid subunit RPN8/RPN11